MVYEKMCNLINAHVATAKDTDENSNEVMLYRNVDRSSCAGAGLGRAPGSLPSPRPQGSEAGNTNVKRGE